MSGAIIAIVVIAALVVLAVVFMLPRLREGVRVRQRERELNQRRQGAATEHRQVADTRARRAEAAEQRARIAEQEARRERAEAELRRERATTHERGMADHELVEEDEREHFAGTSLEEPATADSDGGGLFSRLRRDRDREPSHRD